MSAIEYLKKNFSMACKTIFWDFGRYACFFVLLFLLQCLFSTVLILRVNNLQTENDYLENQYTNQEGYVYHITLQGLSESQHSVIRAAERSFDEESAYFSVVGGTRYTRHLTDGSTYIVYDLEIQFLKPDLKACYRQFSNSYFERLEDLNDRTKFVAVTTPLLDSAMNAALQQAGTWILAAFLLGLSTLMLWVLRSRLTSHYRFNYGIYLSYGATFGRLFMTAAFEMLILNTMLFLPSALTGHLAAWLIHRKSGLPFAIRADMACLALAITLTASMIAVFIDFRRTASRAPVRLLASADNKDVISSPRTSADIFTRTFPEGIERLTRVRFRKYIAGLLTFALLFSTLSAGAAYLSALVRTAMDAPSPEYRLIFAPTVTKIKVPIEEETDGESIETLPPDGETAAPTSPDEDGEEGKYRTETVITYDYSFDGEVAELIGSLPGIGWIRKSCTTAAISINSHILIEKDRVKKSAGGVAVGSEIAFANVDFSALDEQIIAALMAEGAKITGNLSDVLENENMIAICDTFNNTRKLKLKVGDTVRIAYACDPEYAGKSNNAETLFVSTDDLLRDRLSDYRFLYRTYTVGAVVSGLATEGDFPVYLSPAGYTRLTGNEVRFTEAEIVLDKNADKKDLHRLDSELRRMQDVLSNLIVSDLDQAISKQVAENKNPTSILLFLALVLMAASPLIWILSQTLFYLRRRGEMRMYLSMGSELSKVKKIFLSDGLFFGLLGMGVYLILSSAFTGLIYKLANNPYVFQLVSGSGEAFYFRYTYPWLTVLVGMLLMGISGWISVWLPWRSFEKACPQIYGGKGGLGSARKNKKSDQSRKERA